MKIGELKQNFESLILSDGGQLSVACEQAWAHFCDFVQQHPEGEESEEVGFSFSLANINDGKSSRVDPELFQVYFGRLIDAAAKNDWRTVEINFYFRYKMNERLSTLLSGQPTFDKEIYFPLTEENAAVQMKLMDLISFANTQKEIWDEIRTLKPTLASYHFWVW